MKKFILAAFILYLPFQLRLSQVVSLNIVNLFLIFLLLLFIFSRKSNSIKSKFETSLLIFLLIWIFSFLHTLFLGIEIWQWEITKEFKRLFTLVLGYFVFSRCVTTKKDLHFLFYTFLISIILVGLHVWRNGMLAGMHFADFKRSSGPFGIGWEGSDIAGGFLAVFTPFLLSTTLLARKKILKSLGSFGLIICFLGIFATYSRGSMLALGIASIITILIAAKYFLKTSKFTAVVILFIFVVLAFNWQRWVPQSILNRIEGTVQEETYGGESKLDISSQKRIGAWRTSLAIFKMNPIIGVGFKVPEYTLSYDAHNTFIQILAEMGIVGFLAFLWFLWGVFRETASLLNTEFNYLRIGFIGCIIAFIIVNMFYSNFFRDTVVGTFWIALGMLAASKKFAVKTNQLKK